MNSLPPCSRLVLFLLLPFVIVFSVVHLISSSSQIATNNPLSNELSSTISLDSSSTTSPSTASTVVKTIHQRCQPYNVSDTRPFFDREPPQFNLPRRVSNSTRNGLLRRLRGLRLALVACAYNVEKDVDKFRKHVEPIIDLFHPSSRIFILESDSKDNTLEKLRQWPRAKIYTYGNLSRIIPRRTERIAYCRNKLLEKARQLQPDYMLVLDLDIFATNVSSFLTNFDYDTQDWSVMTANLLKKYYYDIWALRTLSDSIMNYDIWHRLWAMEQLKDYCKDTAREYMLDIHIKPFPPERPLLEVRSAFNGAALYKMEATNG